MEYRAMTPEDRDEVRDMYYIFWKWDPLAVGLKMEVPRECKAYVDLALDEALYNGLSMVVVDTSVQKIIAIAVCVLATSYNDQNWTFSDVDCPQMNKEWEILGKLYDGLDLFKLYGVDKMAKVRGLMVDPNYHRRNIGTVLVQKWCNHLEKCHIPLLVAEATSEFSRRVAVSVGFTFLRKMSYDEYIADGTVSMPPDSPHKIMTLTVKPLGT